MRLPQRTRGICVCLIMTFIVSLTAALAYRPIYRKKAIVRAVAACGGQVIYDHWLVNGMIDPWAGTDQPYRTLTALENWTDLVLGPETLNDIVFVSFRSGDPTDEALIALSGLEDLQGAVISPSCCNTTVGAVPVTNNGLRALVLCRKLVVLDLSNTKITDAGLEPLSTLRQLKKLNLAYTLIGDPGISRLQAISDLESLTLTGTQITDTGMRSLMLLSRLKRLSVFHTSVSAHSCKLFEQALPQCYVGFESAVHANEYNNVRTFSDGESILKFKDGG